METDTKEAILIESPKETDYAIGIMEQYIKGSSIMAFATVLANRNLVANFTEVNILIIRDGGMENIFGTRLTFIKGSFSTI
jgi:hypothetical protein